MTVKTKKLTFTKGLLIYVFCFAFTLLGVYLLRQALIPKEEMDCYNRVITLQKAVNQWNQVHPDKIINDEIDDALLTKEGFLRPQTYDHEKHFYFVGETAHGLRVKCNKHEDNPLILRLTGDAILAVMVFVVFCSLRGYVLFNPE